MGLVKISLSAFREIVATLAPTRVQRLARAVASVD